MMYTYEQTDKIFYNGKNQLEVIRFFQKWEEKWVFSSMLTNHHHESFEENKKGNNRCDLIFNSNVSDVPPTIVPFNRYLFFSKIRGDIDNNGKIIFVYTF